MVRKKKGLFTCTRFSVIAGLKVEADSGKLSTLLIEPGVETAIIPHLGGK